MKEMIIKTYCTYHGSKHITAWEKSERKTDCPDCRISTLKLEIERLLDRCEEYCAATKNLHERIRELEKDNE